jgi:hypothetical protein
MHIDLTRDEAELLRDLLKQKILDMDREINRTDSFDFKKGLQQMDRTFERVLGQVSAALESEAS